METREACLKQFSSPSGKTVLQQFSKLYRALVWEGFILLAVAADEEKKSRGKVNVQSDTDNLPSQNSNTKIISNTERDSLDSTQVSITIDSSNHSETMDTSTPLHGMTAGLSFRFDAASDEVISKLSPSAGVHKEEKQPWVSVESLKHLTPLLSITSRVGRSLAELTNLLVRIAITPLIRNPHRRERYREDNYVPPSEDALKICDEVAMLLVDSLKWEVPMPQACSQAMESPIRDWLFAG